MKATELRNSLFPTLERVVRGETVIVLYKGAPVKLTSVTKSSKLARAKTQHALLCDPDAIVSSDAGLQSEMESAWQKDWNEM
ncbi:MAG: hypothetical protein ABIZ80_25490 [Bryobacteraceae bacterium]